MAAMELSSLDGFKKGDVAIISDPATQEEFGEVQVRFNITSVRTFEDKEEDVKFTCYVLTYPLDSDESDGDEEFEPEDLMAVVTEVGGFYELGLYFLNNTGDLDKEENAKTPDYGNLIDKEDGDFADMIILVNNDGITRSQLQWVRKDDSYMGISYEDEDGEDQASLCEYFTEDENYGNDQALVICRGPIDAGKIEMWYGYKLQNHEIELFSE
jgi:hypothetical protein